MIRYLPHKAIDVDAWKRALDASPNRMLYARSWYLDVLCPEWGAVVEGDYARIMPVIFRKKWGVAYLFQSYHAQQLGVFSATPVTPSQVEKFLHAIPRKFRLVDMKLNHGNTISENGFNVVPHQNYELALNAPYEQLAGAYATNVKRNLRKAEGMGLVVQRGEDDHPGMVALFRANKGQHLAMLDEQYYATLDRILTAARQRHLLEVWSVRHPRNGLLGGGIFLRGDGRLIFLLNITTAEGKASSAAHLLIDRVIHHHAGTGNILDFEGSDDPNLARFNRSFGAKESLYLQVMQNRLPQYLRWLKR